MNTTPSDARQTASGPVMTGSQALLESFLIEGVDTLFGYPGGAIIPVYDALYDYPTGCATSSCATSKAPSTPRRAMPA